MDRVDLIQEMSQLLKAAPSVRLAFLFGSMARGTDRVDSDVDIAFMPTDSEMPLSEELSLQARLSIAAKREVDLVRLDLCTPILRFRVATEGVSLVGEPREVSTFRARAAIDHAELAPLLHRANQQFIRRLRLGPKPAGAR
jgi:predicted nucleotidyltransferase